MTDPLFSVVIGATTYAVCSVDDLHSVGDDGRKVGYYGRIDEQHQTIQLNKDQGKDVRVTCLWHEMLHGVLHEAGLPDGHDERVIDALAHGIVSLLRANRFLFDVTVGSKDIDLD